MRLALQRINTTRTLSAGQEVQTSNIFQAWLWETLLPLVVLRPITADSRSVISAV